MKKSLFIVFEGLDGSGKTTQMNALYKHLTKEKNIKCRQEREPGESLPGALARSAVKKKTKFEPQTMALLFAADRYEHIVNDIQPYLDEGVHVLCDRYVFSNFAYQGLELDFETIYEVNKAAMELLMPDVIIFIDTDPAETLARIGKSRVGNELFDKQGVAVRENFYKAFDYLKEKNLIKNLLTVKGSQSEEAVTSEIISYIERLY
ncbi:MAG: dTMP kinase [Oscillospiraceae bacterium]|jgi:dTMP kinase|nr:dTMP kinase [Oscillospiraceae bacterium]